MSKRFLNNYLYSFAELAGKETELSQQQFNQEISKTRRGNELLQYTLQPNELLYQMAIEWYNLNPKETADRVDKLIKFIESQSFDLSEAVKIYKNNGDNKFYEDAGQAFETKGIPTTFYASIVSDTWPLIQSKGAKFSDYKVLLFKAIDRFGFNVKAINDFFTNTLKEIQDSIGIYANSELVIKLAAAFLNDEISLLDLKKILWQQSVIQYGITGKKPTYVEKDKIDKLSDSVSTLKSKPTKEQTKILEYNFEKGRYVQANLEFFKFMANFWMMSSEQSFNQIANKLRTLKVEDFDKIKGEFQNIRKKLLQDLQLLGPSGVLNSESLKELAPNRINKSNNNLYNFKRFAQGQSGQPQSNQELTDIQNPFLREINKFDEASKTILDYIDNEIKNIFDKSKNTNVGEIGIFKQNAVYTYLLDTEKALSEFKTIDRFISHAKDLGASTKSAIISNIDATTIDPKKQKVLGLDEFGIDKYKNLAKEMVNEKFKIFLRNLEQKKFTLQIDKELLKRNNELVQLHQNYDRLKSAIKQDSFSAPFLAPRALKIGFKIAKILEELSEVFGNQAEEAKRQGKNNLSEALERNRDEFINAARDARGFVLTDIYPSFANIIGLQATKPESFSTTFPLTGFSSQASKNVKNKRFADSTKKEIESDQKFRDYWNSLFMQSLDPRPMGDIIEEKPKHGNLTTKEDAKLHKKTMSRFKKTRFKKK